jgi:hypothetical protein
MPLPSKVLTDDYFLSSSNPTATSDQWQLEALALRCLDTPVVIQARQNVAMRWKTIVGQDLTEEMTRRFDELLDEYMFRYILAATNSDSNYPKVLAHLYAPPREWFGMKVPGTRGSGGDGPDNNYTVIPVDHVARFELIGQHFANGLGDVPFTLTGNLSLSMTINSLDWQDVEIDENGRFVITIDPDPANGRPNHLQTDAGVRYLFIRDCRSDWRQIPNAYRIKRLDPPASPPLTEAQIARMGARFAIDDVPAMYWFIRTFAGLEANLFNPPFATGSIGGLVSQMISFARLDLAEDEALILTTGTANAPFRDLVAMDGWFRTFDYWNQTSSFNNSQSHANADGTVTYVVAHRDPGVHNWVDTTGYHQLLMVHRWQGLREDTGSTEKPWVRSSLVKFDDLDSVLADGIKRVSSEERRQQIEARQQAFFLRYIDN